MDNGNNGSEKMILKAIETLLFQGIAKPCKVNSSQVFAFEIQNMNVLLSHSLRTQLAWCISAPWWKQAVCTVYTHSLVNLFCYSIICSSITYPSVPGVGRATRSWCGLQALLQEDISGGLFQELTLLCGCRGRWRQFPFAEDHRRRRAGSCGFARSKGQHLERPGKTITFQP